MAHEISSAVDADIFTFAANKNEFIESDSLPVGYTRIKLPCHFLGRIPIPLPSKQLLSLIRSDQPIIAHLPCPGILTLCTIAKIINSRRKVVVFWHAFLGSKNTLAKIALYLYEFFAIKILNTASAVITTSPVLAEEIGRLGCQPEKIKLLPCCIPIQTEKYLLCNLSPESNDYQLKIIYIGRLDSYKRVDWLLLAADEANRQCHESISNFAGICIDIVGGGPKIKNLQEMAKNLSVDVRFHGRAAEDKKIRILQNSDVLVLPSESSNEAFGIVQLEAMAAGVFSLAFSLPKSGMGWVCNLPDFNWSQDFQGLSSALKELAMTPGLSRRLGSQARKRYLDKFSHAVWKDNLMRILPCDC